MNYFEERQQLTEVIRYLAARGWSPGTGGNFSTVIKAEPLTLLMSPSGIDKSVIESNDLILVDKHGAIIQSNKENAKTSAETLIHIFLCKHLGARAVLHTHSTWNTILSRKFCNQTVTLEGFEMLKALGATTHDTSIKVPVFENDQDMERFTAMLEKNLSKLKSQPGFLMAGHGLYAWGDSLSAAKRHIEAFEFLLEVVGTETQFSR
jgi:methylthioribulose-1-phosphate dehydratase